MIKSSLIMPQPPLNSRPALANLRRSWAAFVLFAVCFLAAGYLLLQSAWLPAAALRWLAQASLLIIYLALVLWRNLESNRQVGAGPLLPDLGWANRMTLLRGVLIAALVGFVFLPRPPAWLAWLPAILYTLAIIADGLDGYLARKTARSTRLGAILDLSFDGLGVLAAALLLVQYGQVPAWYVLVALARYLFLAGEWILSRLGRPVHPLQPDPLRRAFASIQFIFIAVLLYPLFSPPLTWVAAACFALPFLAGFLLDFFRLSGALPAKPAASASYRFLPVVFISLRLVLALLALASAFQLSLAMPDPTWAGSALLVSQLLAASLVVFGLAGRISAGLALGLLGLGQVIFPPTLIQVLQVVGYTAVVYIGTGPFSVFSPEEAWFGAIRPTQRPRSSSSRHETLPQAH